jgi:hypothetical protein
MQSLPRRINRGSGSSRRRRAAGRGTPRAARVSEMSRCGVAAAPANAEQWLARVMVLKENVQHHVKVEETEVFPIAKEKIDDDEAKRLAASFLPRSRAEPASPRPRLLAVGHRRISVDCCHASSAERH